MIGFIIALFYFAFNFGRGLHLIEENAPPKQMVLTLFFGLPIAIYNLVKRWLKKKA
jgi:hypothetical protein